MKKYIQQNIAKVIALSSSIITIWSAFFSEQFSDFIKNNELKYFFSFVLLNAITICFISKSKEKIKLKINDMTNIDITYGDIFSKNGIIVIPVNEYFDTLVDDVIISSKTLHGKFIKRFFQNDVTVLDTKIDEALVNKEFTINLSRKSGKNKKYPLGTIANININNRKFFLIALTNFNENDHANVLKTDYQKVLIKLFEYIENFSNAERVNIPLIGGGHSGINLSSQRKLEFILMTMYLSNNLCLQQGLEIVLYDFINTDINLNNIEFLFRN